MMVELGTSWRLTPTEFTYRLGEIRFFCATLWLRVLQAHFTTLPDDPGQIAVPLKGDDKKEAGILIRSHPLKTRLHRFAWIGGTVRYVPHQYRRYYVQLGGRFDDYLRKFSPKSRSTLRRKVQRCARHCGGTLRCREYASPEEMADFYQLARHVSEKTYQEKVLDAGLPTDDDFRAKMADLAARGMVRGYLLFHGARPAAYLYCPVVGQDILLYQHLGYDPDFRECSPGTVLQYLVLERLFAEQRFRLFDFTEGEGLQKQFFATGSALCADIYYLRPTVKNLSIMVSHALTDLFSEAVGRMLNRAGLGSRVRRLLRSWFGRPRISDSDRPW